MNIGDKIYMNKKPSGQFRWLHGSSWNDSPLIPFGTLIGEITHVSQSNDSEYPVLLTVKMSIEGFPWDYVAISAKADTFTTDEPVTGINSIDNGAAATDTPEKAPTKESGITWVEITIALAVVVVVALLIKKAF